METKANYVLVGAFTLAGLIGVLAFFLWFARVELDRQFAYYGVDFSSVSGLDRASEVRFSGLPVGQVVSLGLSPDGTGTVRARLEIDAKTPVRTDSIATVEAQGVTGVSYVAISAGSPAAPLLATTADDPVPVIRAGRSAIQSLTEEAPLVISEILVLVEDIGALVSNENRTRIETILQNLATSSDSLSQALADVSAVSGSISDAVDEIVDFTAGLEDISAAATNTLRNRR